MPDVDLWPTCAHNRFVHMHTYTTHAPLYTCAWALELYPSSIFNALLTIDAILHARFRSLSCLTETWCILFNNSPFSFHQTWPNTIPLWILWLWIFWIPSISKIIECIYLPVYSSFPLSTTSSGLINIIANDRNLVAYISQNLSFHLLIDV